MKKKLAAAFVFWCLLVYTLVMGGISSYLTDQDNRGSRTNSQIQLARSNHNNRRRPHQRQLMGPGSYPPRCTGKCGRCVPCRPVRVTVPPGANTDVAEYYPVAWRCKCGGRLYTP